MGLVADHGHWVRPEKVAEARAADPTLSNRLAEYNSRREKLDRSFTTDKTPGHHHHTSPARVSSHIQLGLWCEQNDLPDEARAHFTTAVILDPRRKTPWQHMGYTRQTDGSWKTAQQLFDEKAEVQAQDRADKKWVPQLRAYRDTLDAPSTREALAQIHDPRAVPAIAQIFGIDGFHNEVAVQLLGQIDTAPSARELARLALDGPPEVLDSASEALKGRSLRDWAGALVETLRTPMRYWVEPVGGPGSPGALILENVRYRMFRSYDAPPIVSFLSNTVSSYDSNGLLIIETKREADRPIIGPNLVQIEMRTAALIANANLKAANSQRRLYADIMTIETMNADQVAFNQRITQLLTKVLDAPATLGSDENAWMTWYNDKIGYSYTPPKQTILAVNASPQSAAPMLGGHAACFVAGTLVRTLDGHRPIETLTVGDRVLAQNPKTGELTFRTVNLIHHNPPAPTLHIKTATGETIIPSIYHRFWKAGKGWALARELVAGDELRTLGDASKITEISVGHTLPVYNLDVVDDHTYFVGPNDALVHDNTLPDPHARPFDAPVLAAVK